MIFSFSRSFILAFLTRVLTNKNPIAEVLITRNQHSKGTWKSETLTRDEKCIIGLFKDEIDVDTMGVKKRKKAAATPLVV